MNEGWTKDKRRIIEAYTAQVPLRYGGAMDLLSRTYHNGSYHVSNIIYGFQHMI